MYNEEKKIKREQAYDLLDAIAGGLLLIMCCVLIIGSSSYFLSMKERNLYDLAIFITVITILVQWIDGRITAITRYLNKQKSILNLNIKDNERRNNGTNIRRIRRS